MKRGRFKDLELFEAGLGKRWHFIGFKSMMEHMFDHHGFCELETVDASFFWFYNDSGAIGRGHWEVEANPQVVGNTPWGGIGEGPLL